MVQSLLEQLIIIQLTKECLSFLVQNPVFQELSKRSYQTYRDSAHSSQYLQDIFI